MLAIIVIFCTSIASYYLFFHKKYFRHNPNGNWEMCMNNIKPKEFSFIDWSKKNNIRIDFIESGNKYCFGVGFPVVNANHPKANNWIHIVKINTAPKMKGTGCQISNNPKKWVFIDTSQESRERGSPFYSDIADNLFWDNPSWTRENNNDKITWDGYAFPVIVRGNVVTPIGGFSWGYHLKAKQEKPIVLKPKAVSQSVWNSYTEDLNEEYKDWKFNVFPVDSASLHNGLQLPK